MLDTDLASLYGVPTFRFNEAFKRNHDRFPPDFAFQLTAAEFAALNWSQSVTSSSHPTDDPPMAPNSSQSAMSSRKHRGAVYRPWAFTEHGALMAASAAPLLGDRLAPFLEELNRILAACFLFSEPCRSSTAAGLPGVRIPLAPPLT
jgi:alkylation response protein AidB-like acyl-CoA dehydrogenase